VPDILAELATVQMHAIQTSGNCIRNTTTDQFAGVAPDEIVDPRPWCELIRQWSTFHPEFAFLPRKFKIAVNGAVNRPRRHAGARHRPAGVRNADGEDRFPRHRGRRPGPHADHRHVIRDFLPGRHLLTYLDAILRVYNRYGRRDNKYKARIKILVKATGAGRVRRQVEANGRTSDGPGTADRGEVERAAPSSRARLRRCRRTDAASTQPARREPAFPLGGAQHRAHKRAGLRRGHAVAQATGVPPGDVTADADGRGGRPRRPLQLRRAARVARTEPVLPTSHWSDLHDLWGARRWALATPNIGLLTDIICCPGGDFCSLANAKSIPMAPRPIQRRFDDLDYQHDIGELDLNISGCMNACGHHHVGHIGILGVDKKGRGVLPDP
jgi:sulfite reductase (NADPH) hemoprotein beta-component